MPQSSAARASERCAQNKQRGGNRFHAAVLRSQTDQQVLCITNRSAETRISLVSSSHRKRLSHTQTRPPLILSARLPPPLYRPPSCPQTHQPLVEWILVKRFSCHHGGRRSTRDSLLLLSSRIVRHTTEMGKRHTHTQTPQFFSSPNQLAAALAAH